MIKRGADRAFSEAELAQYRKPPAEVPTVPNSMVRLLFQRMVELQISYEALEKRSGVSFWTVRKWRTGVEPTNALLAKTLMVVGYEIRLTAVPIRRSEGA